MCLNPKGQEIQSPLRDLKLMQTIDLVHSGRGACCSQRNDNPGLCGNINANKSPKKGISAQLA